MYIRARQALRADPQEPKEQRRGAREASSRHVVSHAHEARDPPVFTTFDLK